jgi:circadian clock protein KaiC
VAEEAKRNGRSLFVSFEEPEKQLIEHAKGFGWNVNKFMDKGLAKFSSYTPEPFNVEQQLDEILGFLEKYRPARLAIDSIDTLERVMLEHRYLRWIKSLTLYLKDKGITTLFTALYKSVMPLSGTALSSSVDNIIALKHVEIESTLRRATVILKARGSAHDNEIREFEITTKGVVLKGKFAGMEQILGGAPRKSMTKRGLGRCARATYPDK